MPVFQQSRELPFKAEDLYRLVINIESYPDFVPGVMKTDILERKDSEMIADLHIGHRLLHTSYRSKVKFNPYEYIKAEGISGPFEYLYNSWFFQNVQNKSRIEFFVDFKSKGFVMGKIVDLVFEDLCKEMMVSFEKRAYSILSNV